LGESGSQPDGDIVRRVLEGEVELFGVLVERYRAEFARYATALVGDPDRASDAMQEAFIRAYRSLASCRDLKRVSGRGDGGRPRSRATTSPRGIGRTLRCCRRS